MGITAPNTNKNAVEGSNPVYNEEKKMPDFDESRYKRNQVQLKDVFEIYVLQHT